MKQVWRRAALGVAATMVTTLGLAGSASAGVLVESPAECPEQSLAQVFAPWGDRSWYTQVPNGGLEHGANGWSLTGSARVVAGNEPWKVSGPGASSVRIPSGSSALSPPLCVGVEHPTIRFFAKKNSGLLSTLSVSAQIKTSLGLTVELPFGVLVGGSQWKPSPAYLYLGNLLTLLPGQYTEMRFRFTPLLGGDWQVDDVYVDPYRAK